MNCQLVVFQKKQKRPLIVHLKCLLKIKEGRKLIKDNKNMDNKTLKLLREDLIGELGAINQYQEHIDDINDDEAKKVIEHIRDDEKEHVAELIKVIRKLDIMQEEKFQKEEL